MRQRLGVVLVAIVVLAATYGVVTQELSFVKVPTVSTHQGGLPPSIAYVLGDSNTVGLDTALQPAFPPKWEIIVRGRRGRTVLTWSHPSGYEQAQLDVGIIQRAQIVIIGLGVNNEQGDDGVDFAQAMKTLVGYLKSHMQRGARLYWLSLYNPVKADHIAQRNQTIREVSNTPGYRFAIIPWASQLAKHPGWRRRSPLPGQPRDPVHLSPAGYQQMAGYIAGYVMG